MSLLPHISKWFVGELLTRPTNLPMNPVAKLLSQSKCDYVVSKGLWANLSCRRHPPGKQPKPCWHKAVPNREIVSPSVSCALYHRPTCPRGCRSNQWQCYLAFVAHISFFKYFIILCCVYSTSPLHSAPAHTCLRLQQCLYSLQYPSHDLSAYVIIASSFDSKI